MYNKIRLEANCLVVFLLLLFSIVVLWSCATFSECYKTKKSKNKTVKIITSST